MKSKINSINKKVKKTQHKIKKISGGTQFN